MLFLFENSLIWFDSEGNCSLVAQLTHELVSSYSCGRVGLEIHLLYTWKVLTAGFEEKPCLFFAIFISFWSGLICIFASYQRFMQKTVEFPPLLQPVLRLMLAIEGMLRLERYFFCVFVFFPFYILYSVLKRMRCVSDLVKRKRQWVVVPLYYRL